MAYTVVSSADAKKPLGGRYNYTKKNESAAKLTHSFVLLSFSRGKAVVHVLERCHVRSGFVYDVFLDIRGRQQVVYQKSVLIEQLFKLSVGKRGFHGFAARFCHHYCILHAVFGGAKEVLVWIIEHYRAAVRAYFGEGRERFLYFLEREIICNSEPREKRLHSPVKSAFREPFREAVIR